MIFYIVASEDENIKCNLKDSIYTGIDNLKESIEQYENATKSLEYKHLYFLVDFGTVISGIRKYTHLDINSKDSSIYLIGEYHEGFEDKYIYRNDVTIIKTSKAKKYFNDNFKAIYNFVNLLSIPVIATMSIGYRNDDGELIERKIAETGSIIKARKNGLKYAKKISINKMPEYNERFDDIVTRLAIM